MTLAGVRIAVVARRRARAGDRAARGRRRREVRAFGFPWPDGGHRRRHASRPTRPRRCAARRTRSSRSRGSPPTARSSRRPRRSRSSPTRRCCGSSRPAPRHPRRRRRPSLRAAAASAGIDPARVRARRGADAPARARRSSRARCSRRSRTRDVTIHDADVAVVGHGTIGALLARTLVLLGARVTVVARNPVQRAAARADRRRRRAARGASPTWPAQLGDAVLHRAGARSSAARLLERMRRGCARDGPGRAARRRRPRRSARARPRRRLGARARPAGSGDRRSEPVAGNPQAHRSDRGGTRREGRSRHPQRARRDARRASSTAASPSRDGRSSPSAPTSALPGGRARDRRRRPRAHARRDRPALPPRRQLPVRRGHAHRDGCRQRAAASRRSCSTSARRSRRTSRSTRSARRSARRTSTSTSASTSASSARSTSTRSRRDRRRDGRPLLQALLRLRAGQPDRHRAGDRRLGLRDDAQGRDDPGRRRLRPLREHRHRDLAQGGADGHRPPGPRRLHRVAAGVLRGGDDRPDDLPRRADRLPALHRPHDGRAGAGDRRDGAGARHRRDDRDVPALPDALLLRPRPRHAREDLAAAARHATRSRVSGAASSPARCGSLGSDHVPFFPKEGEDLWTEKPGIVSFPWELPLLLTEGVHNRGLPLSRLVEMNSYTPARRFGLYPRKGVAHGRRRRRSRARRPGRGARGRARGQGHVHLRGVEAQGLAGADRLARARWCTRTARSTRTRPGTASASRGRTALRTARNATSPSLTPDLAAGDKAGVRGRT